MRPDRSGGPAKSPLQPRAQLGFLRGGHARLAALPTIPGQSPPAIALIGLVPTPDRIVVQIQELCDLGATFAVIEQQKRVRPACDAMIFALATHAGFQFAAIFEGEKTGTYHGCTRIVLNSDVKPSCSAFARLPVYADWREGYPAMLAVFLGGDVAANARAQR